MPRHNRKANGKARPVVAERRLRPTPEPGRNTPPPVQFPELDGFALLPEDVRTTGDVVQLLGGDVLAWIEALGIMIEAGAPRAALVLVVHDLRQVVEACVRALREGHFPRFRDAGAEGDFAEWFEAARRVMAWCDELGDAEYGHDTVRRLLDVAERRRRADDAARAASPADAAR
jgi:hypothetical protein